MITLEEAGIDIYRVYPDQPKLAYLADRAAFLGPAINAVLANISGVRRGVDNATTPLLHNIKTGDTTDGLFMSYNLADYLISLGKTHKDLEEVVEGMTAHQARIALFKTDHEVGRC